MRGAERLAASLHVPVRTFDVLVPQPGGMLCMAPAGACVERSPPLPSS